MDLKFLKKDRILASQIFRDAFSFLSEKFSQARNILTAASPYTQILQVVSELGELIFQYIENAISELNFATAKNDINIKGKARLTGHNPTRGLAAQGKIGLRLRSGAEGKFDGDHLLIPKFNKVLMVSNQLTYLLLFDTDFLKIEKNNTEFQEVRLLQGEVESQTFVSDETRLQSFSAITTNTTDHFFVNIFVNGERWEVFDSLYDMDRETKGVLIKTGLSSGIDVFFGNGNFGVIPELGAIIKVEYLVTRGSSGNLPSIDAVQIQFEDPGLDIFGEELDLNDLILIKTIMPPSFGADPEEPGFTKLIAPNSSRSFVLANPSNYIHFFRRFGFFSHVDAHTTFEDEFLDDDNVIYLTLIPDITKKLTSDTDFFTIDEEEFRLTDEEINELKRLLNESGRQMVTAEVNFIKPTITRYAITIILRYFDRFDKVQIRSDIKTRLSEYFLKVKRRDKIPRSDIITIVEGVEGVDSVNVFFVSQVNEEAISNGFFEKKIFGYDPVKKRREVIEIKKIPINEGEDPNLGLDEFGDIAIGENELPIIRGDWNDRNGKFVETFPDNNKLSSFNVFFKEKVSFDIFNKINSDNFKKLKEKNV